MAYTTIDNPELFFQTKLFTGTGSELSVTLDGSENMQPDWVWIKDRQDTHLHNLFDSVRGVTKRIHSDTTDAESTHAESLKSFDSDGFTLGTQTNVNQSSHTNVSWNWKAGTSFSNDASATSVGTIDSSGSVNTTAGFSIISYTGTGSAGTIAHGLGSVPAWILTKNRDASQPWRIYQKAVDASAPEDYGLILNNTTVRDNDNTAWNDTAPTSSVFSVGSSANTNNGSDDFIAYCFAEKKGYSKFGSFVGNGNANGPFIYTGFKPAWVMIKANDSENWIIFDNKRPGYNLTDALLKPNLYNAESTTGVKFDMLSNGFKVRVNDAEGNGNGNTNFYFAFAESPFVNSKGVPNNAR